MFELSDHERASVAGEGAAAMKGWPVNRWISINARWAFSAARICSRRVAVNSDWTCAHSR
jgi:hypothetical protein